MFSTGPNYTKLKTHLRLAINRLKLLEKKKTELAQKSRKEIADYISAGKYERAKIRVEHIIREDYMVEAMEVVEMYCDLLLARFGLVQQMKTLDEGLAEAISSILWVAPRLQTDVGEMKVIADLLTAKYGRQYADACRDEAVASISEKLKHKMCVQSPPKLLVEKYLIEIAKNYNLEYEPDPQTVQQLGKIFPSTEVLVDLRNMFKKAPKSFCTAVTVSPDSLSPLPSAFSAMKTSDPQFPGLSVCLVETQESPENIEGDSDAPEPAAGS